MGDRDKGSGDVPRALAVSFFYVPFHPPLYLIPEAPFLWLSLLHPLCLSVSFLSSSLHLSPSYPTWLVGSPWVHRPPHHIPFSAYSFLSSRSPPLSPGSL